LVKLCKKAKSKIHRFRTIACIANDWHAFLTHIINSK
jgi:hypothetical protein